MSLLKETRRNFRKGKGDDNEPKAEKEKLRK